MTLPSCTTQELAAQQEAARQARASKAFMLHPRTPAQRCTEPQPFKLKSAAREVRASCAAICTFVQTLSSSRPWVQLPCWGTHRLGCCCFCIMLTGALCLQAEPVPSEGPHQAAHRFRPQTLERHCSNVFLQIARLHAGVEDTA